MGVAGDLNNDGILDRNDIDLLNTILGSNPAVLKTLSPEDLALLDVNHDGQIDQNDLNALCQKVLSGANPASSEPLQRLQNKLRQY